MYNANYKFKNITRLNGTDPSMDPKLLLIEGLLTDCYNDNNTHSIVLPDIQDSNGLECPRTFDGFACWDETPAKRTAFQHCPNFVVGFEPARFAFKRCSENGTWDSHPEGDKPWTNYTSCVDVEDLDFRSVVNDIYVYGYMLSVVALLVSIVIFLSFKSLYCTRIRVHLQLFISFAVNNILWIVWYKTVVNDVNVLQHNLVWCQMLHLFMNYSMVTSYFWMFNEGLHLYIALVVVFAKEDYAMKAFLVFGWLMSFIVVAAYAVSRYLTGEIERCWMEHSESFWIIVVPVVLSLVVSLFFLINVLWVLIMKLYPSTNPRATIAITKATRAALILIPLFGLHFILIPFRPAFDSPYEKTYQVVSALLTSLQGLCVSILFCFTNNEVHTAVRNFLAWLWLSPDSLPTADTRKGGFYIHWAHRYRERMCRFKYWCGYSFSCKKIRPRLPTYEEAVTAGESLANTRENAV